MSHHAYRRPTVCVIGAGAAGAAAACECALAGFETTLVDAQEKAGGRYAGPAASTPPRRWGYRKGNLRKSGYNGSAESACAHIQAALSFAHQHSSLHTVYGRRVQRADFSAADGQWCVEDSAGETLVADVLIIATDANSVPELRDTYGRAIELPTPNVHLDMVPIGVPNLLLMNLPEPAPRRWDAHPLAVVEAKADYAQRWVRHLEIHGPSVVEVRRSYWTAAPPVRKSLISLLKGIDDASYIYHPVKKVSTR